MLPACTCGGVVIENWALMKSFYVCTECKQEVFAMPETTPAATADLSEYEQLELYKPWLSGETLADNNKDDDHGQETFD